MLRALAGHCHAPIVGHAVADTSGGIRLAARVYAPVGSVVLHSEQAGHLPEDVGNAVAENLIGQGRRERVLATSRRG